VLEGLGIPGKGVAVLGVEDFGRVHSIFSGQLDVIDALSLCMGRGPEGRQNQGT
jgi:hypothetical protein